MKIQSDIPKLGTQRGNNVEVHGLLVWGGLEMHMELNIEEGMVPMETSYGKKIVEV